jgi:L-alanine-DL-glutamate epimerase-like enolase superfamily enzyme
VANNDVEWLFERRHASDGWHIGRVAHQQKEWIVVQATSNGMAGEAWGPFSERLQHEVETLLDLADRHQERPTAGDRGSEDALLACGLIATSKLELTSRRYGVPLHLWLGGTLRTSVRVAVPIVFHGETPRRRGPELERAEEHIRNCHQRLGITSFAIYDSSPDIDLIASSLPVLRFEAGLGATLTLHLPGQFDVDQTQRLCSQVQDCGLTYMADPCASIAMAAKASRDRLPALGLSVWKYEREDLLASLPETPPAVLLVDPLLEGGPTAVRKLASIARVLQSEVCLTAEKGGTWLTYHCVELAAVVPASHQPVQLPTGLSIEDLQALGVRSGKLLLPGLPNRPALETVPDHTDNFSGPSPVAEY